MLSKKISINLDDKQPVNFRKGGGCHEYSLIIFINVIFNSFIFAKSGTNKSLAVF